MIGKELDFTGLDDAATGYKQAIDKACAAYMNDTYRKPLDVHHKANEARIDYLDQVPGSLYRLMKEDIGRVWRLLESPIEQVAIFQLAAVNYGKDEWPIYAKVARERGMFDHKNYPVQIIPQVSFGRFRVDFLFDLGAVGLVAIECDGAEFHTDAAKDWARDEYLREEHGVKVYRLSGKSIWRGDGAARMWADMVKLYLSWGSTNP